MLWHHSQGSTSQLSNHVFEEFVSSCHIVHHILISYTGCNFTQDNSQLEYKRAIFKSVVESSYCDNWRFLCKLTVQNWARQQWAHFYEFCPGVKILQDWQELLMGSTKRKQLCLKTEKDSDLIGKWLCLSARRLSGVKRGGVEPRKWSAAGIEIWENGRGIVWFGIQTSE